MALVIGGSKELLQAVEQASLSAQVLRTCVGVGMFVGALVLRRYIRRV